ncbi:unnamed protein product [Rhizoctonia solani]|uniref:Uncharacterized protein n=1 Tax=Rhizoctonia solani TaxID=456999 RepID=A0A8H3DKV4_9AGAM|nr:unnamed protein product [Rhizoctonia solani]
MAGPIIPLATPSITEWEEAGTSLANALSRYLNLCTSLGTNSLQEGARANDLVARIDSKLESLHVSMEQQVAQARSALSKTLNDIASPVHCLPEEILTKIFAYVIYSAQYRNIWILKLIGTPNPGAFAGSTEKLGILVSTGQKIAAWT